jgi:hypothetical protein
MQRSHMLNLFFVCWATFSLAAGCSENSAPAMTHGSPGAATDRPVADHPTADVPAKLSEATPGKAVDAPSPSGEPAAQSDDSANTPERIRDISFDDLKFEIEKGDPFKRSLLTDKIEALNGKRVRIRGFILPSFQQTGLTQFVLVRDNLSCCFGPGAAIYDCVIVEMKPGESTDYSLYPVAVEGTFTISELLDPEGKTVAIYHLDGEQVR